MERPADPLFAEEEIPICDQVAGQCAVESVTADTIPVVGDVPSPQGFRSYRLEFDRNGNRTRQEKFDRAGTLIGAGEYDGAGRLSMPFRTACWGCSAAVWQPQVLA